MFNTGAYICTLVKTLMYQWFDIVSLHHVAIAIAIMFEDVVHGDFLAGYKPY